MSDTIKDNHVRLATAMRLLNEASLEILRVICTCRCCGLELGDNKKLIAASKKLEEVTISIHEIREEL